MNASGLEPVKKAPHSGAFDGLRLAAALAVLFSHSYPLTGHADAEPLIRWTNSGIGFGELAVYIFFAMSGYLVTQSWQRDPSFKRFMTKRLLRIVPALACVVILSALVVGAVMGSHNLAAYYGNVETWLYLAKILIYPAQYGLPGVFTQNPFPDVVNGSLWSLRVEFSLYVILAIFCLVGFLRFRNLALIFAMTSLAADIALSRPGLFGHLAFLHQLTLFFANAVPFFMGAYLAQTDLRSKFLWGVAAGTTMATLYLVGTAAFPFLLLLALPLVTILIAHFGACDLSRWGDLSYGVYVWGFVIQQIIVARAPDIASVTLFAAASPVVLIIAWFSWHFIEKPALTMKPSRS